MQGAVLQQQNRAVDRLNGVARESGLERLLGRLIALGVVVTGHQ